MKTLTDVSGVMAGAVVYPSGNKRLSVTFGGINYYDYTDEGGTVRRNPVFIQGFEINLEKCTPVGYGVTYPCTTDVVPAFLSAVDVPAGMDDIVVVAFQAFGVWTFGAATEFNAPWVWPSATGTIQYVGANVAGSVLAPWAAEVNAGVVARLQFNHAGYALDQIKTQRPAGANFGMQLLG